MTDEELTAAFPFGAMLVPADGSTPSSRVRVGQEWVDDDDGDYFRVWLDPYRDLFLQRSLDPEFDGFQAVSANGAKYFLRPLPEEDQPTF